MMFERLTHQARRVVVLAQESARERAEHHVGTEHLLFGLCQVGDSTAATLLAERGVDTASVTRDLAARRAAGRPDRDQPDRDALASVGIDLDEVRDRVEDAIGPGALENTRAAGRGRRGREWGHNRFDTDAKMTFAIAVSTAQRDGDRHVDTEHLLLALVELETGVAAQLLAGHGVTAPAMRQALNGGLPGTAASG